MRSFFTGKTSVERIGPHNLNIISIIIGSLLGDGHLEKRTQGLGTRIKFEQSSDNVEYLMWFHSYLSERGYCNTNKPKLKKRIRKNGTVYYHYSINSFTFSSLNWVHDLWYIDGKKIVPKTIGNYLNPLALAIWIMDDGSKSGKGLKLNTNSFSFSDCIFLTEVLSHNFNIKSSVESAGCADQYVIYIWKESMPLLRDIVLPYVHSSMKYKLI